MLLCLHDLVNVGVPDGGGLPQKSLEGNCVQPSGPVLLAFLFFPLLPPFSLVRMKPVFH